MSRVSRKIIDRSTTQIRELNFVEQSLNSNLDYSRKPIKTVSKFMKYSLESGDCIFFFFFFKKISASNLKNGFPFKL